MTSPLPFISKQYKTKEFLFFASIKSIYHKMYLTGYLGQINNFVIVGKIGAVIRKQILAVAQRSNSKKTYDSIKSQLCFYLKIQFQEWMLSFCDLVDINTMLKVPIKGILNSNFRPFNFESKKLDFLNRVLWPQKLKIFEILFPLSSLMTSPWEPHNRLLTSIKLSRQLNPH